MSESNRIEAIKQFVDFWRGKGYEKGQCQPFWLSFLRDVLEVKNPESIIDFEAPVGKIDSTSFMDGYIASTSVLIEQKSAGKDLDKPIRQGDGSYLTPFQQAKKYSADLPYSKRPRWIITCNFRELRVYDMEKPNGDPEKISIDELPREYYRLRFIVDSTSERLQRETEISVKAGDLVGLLYDELLEQYIDPQNEKSQKSLNKLCVRIVFCLYAEDSGLFGAKMKFHDYIKGYAVKDVRDALIRLFKVLDTKVEERDPYLDDTLASFPYVNGGLFAEEDIEIPQFTDKIVNLLLRDTSENFDWSKISPTIFGAVFESTLNPETRRKGGMHYTSIENIHKVIDPLFLDDLKEEFDKISAIQVAKTREKELRAFQDKLAKLTFLDPACGSGNFLTETYLSLRRLENEVLKRILGAQIAFEAREPIQVSIEQFYGIEINDFAVTVAKTALWIAESQMMQETEQIIHQSLEFFPLVSYANIVEADALDIEWEGVMQKGKPDYIMGNPPFIGAMMMTPEQRTQLKNVVGELKGVGEMDYVVAWYFKAAQYIQNSAVECAFVSTNSICQGQQAVTVWKPLFEKGVRIQFAYRTFRWDSEANIKAHVHCVIVGFSLSDRKIKRLYDGARVKTVGNINAYLSDSDNIFIDSRSTPLCKVPPMHFGNMPRDNGGFVLTEYEKDELIASYPKSEKWIHLYLGAEEFINNKKRYCLWLVDANPTELHECKIVMKRIQAVREFRLESHAEATRKLAQTPTRFAQITQPLDADFLIVPSVSSQNRKYVPMGFLKAGVVVSNAVQIVPNATLYHFGVLTSNVHMAWMRTVCGRLKSDYRYSKDIVYNNFPWCTPTDEQKKKIEQTAQAILDARAIYAGSSLADLYDEATMPVELRKAHQANDKAVMQAYGFWGKLNSETECVAELFKLYEKLTKGE